jgi:hypothetical protein
MKGTSMLLTAALLFLAHLLALHLKRSGTLPLDRPTETLSAEKEIGPSHPATPVRI